MDREQSFATIQHLADKYNKTGMKILRDEQRSRMLTMSEDASTRVHKTL